MRSTGNERARPLARRQSVYILNHMVQYPQTRFDTSFAALSTPPDAARLEQLGRATLRSRSAEKFHMTLTGMKKHVGLGAGGTRHHEKVGRVGPALGPRRLEEEAAWIERYRQLVGALRRAGQSC